ncbi:MAG: FtsW/RodA/SpoVE family cell cycle protein [Peptococcales bacterium]|jgi:cell division protein FtsW (lipid II flippase)/cell division protein FtsI/penicillin-binding protein 2
MMVNNTKGSNFIYLALFMGLAGFLSLTVHVDQITNLFLPTLLLLVSLFITFFLVNRITGEVNLLFCLVMFMEILGWLILLRLEPQLAVKQLIWIILGCILLLLGLKFLKMFPRDFILKYNLPVLFVTLLLLFLPLVIGIRVGGAKSWLEFLGFRFQPAEIAKVSYLVFIAGWLKEKSNTALDRIWPIWLGTFVAIGLLVLQKDLGTALIFYLTFLLTLYLISGKLRHTALGVILLMVGSIIAYFYFPHVNLRAQVWLNPWLEPDSSGYQILQSLFALASGGIVGMGLGGGMPRAIPEAHTDFVFAVIGEQLGLLGTSGVVLLYLFFTYFSLKRVQFIPTLGSRFLAAGLTFMIVVQAFVIMGGVSKLIPLTGLPLPFMSYGGSSTISSFVMLGIIIWLGREKDFVEINFRRRLINIIKLLALCFLSVLIILFYWQVVKAPDLFNHPLNPRLRAVERQTVRGKILAADGSILAENKPGIGRFYPLGEAAAHIIGYDSPQYKKAGLESALDSILLGIPDVKVGFFQEKRQGFNVFTTIEPDLQKLAWSLHQDYQGASVVLDIKTGNILALVSSPSYDPNNLQTNFTRYQEENTFFFNRATQGLYPPGSVFKIITGTALLKLKPEVTKNSLFLEPQLDLKGYPISDLVYRPKLNFQEALGYSSNLYFVKHFLDFSWEDIEKTLITSFKITKDFSSSELQIAKAQLGQVTDLLDLAFSIIGQGEVLITPLHMAIWGGAIANKGLIMQPQIIHKVENAHGSIVEKRKPQVLGSVCSEEVAEIILQGLEFSVQKGTGTKAQSAKVRIGGKTGTAENIHGDPHAWFIGIAPLENPRVVVATIVEHGGRGGEVAAPISKNLIEAALE